MPQFPNPLKVSSQTGKPSGIAVYWSIEQGQLSEWAMRCRGGSRRSSSQHSDDPAGTMVRAKQTRLLPSALRLLKASIQQGPRARDSVQSTSLIPPSLPPLLHGPPRSSEGFNTSQAATLGCQGEEMAPFWPQLDLDGSYPSVPCGERAFLQRESESIFDIGYSLCKAIQSSFL